MANLTLTSDLFPNRPRRLARLRAALGLFRPSGSPAPEDIRARQAFIQDVLAHSPGAFSSDLDVQAMMQCFPGRF